MKPFTTDGCSGGLSFFWRAVTGHPPPWESLCKEHDFAYWKGGSRVDRLKADRALRDGILAQGYDWWGMAVFIGVRLGGVSWLPLPWRWGFGHRFPKSRPSLADRGGKG